MTTTFQGYVSATVTVPAAVAISVTNSGGGPTVVTITAGTYDVIDLLGQIEDDLDSQRAPSAGTWRVTVDTTPDATGKVTITTTQGSAFSITWTSTVLRDLLGFTADISSQTTSTGANHMKGLWIPDAPVTVESALRAAPLVTDLRSVESPTGALYSHVGNSRYRLRNVRWSHVPVARVWTAEAATNESLQAWLLDTQFGLGHVWFSPSSKIEIVDHGGEVLANEDTSPPTVSGWRIKGVRSIDDMVKRVDGAWDGMWAVSIGELVSAGS